MINVLTILFYKINKLMILLIENIKLIMCFYLKLFFFLYSSVMTV